MIKIQATTNADEEISFEAASPQVAADIITHSVNIDYWEFDGTPEEINQIFFLVTGEIPNDEAIASCAISRSGH